MTLTISREERWGMIMALRTRLGTIIPSRNCFRHDIGQSKADPKLSAELRGEIRRMIALYRRILK
jgi:hypothetical protein